MIYSIYFISLAVCYCNNVIFHAIADYYYRRFVSYKPLILRITIDQNQFNLNLDNRLHSSIAIYDDHVNHTII